MGILKASLCHCEHHFPLIGKSNAWWRGKVSCLFEQTNMFNFCDVCLLTFDHWHLIFYFIPHTNTCHRWQIHSPLPLNFFTIQRTAYVYLKLIWFWCTTQLMLSFMMFFLKFSCMLTFVICSWELELVINVVLWCNQLRYFCLSIVIHKHCRGRIFDFLLVTIFHI